MEGTGLSCLGHLNICLTLSPRVHPEITRFIPALNSNYAFTQQLHFRFVYTILTMQLYPVYPAPIDPNRCAALSGSYVILDIP